MHRIVVKVSVFLVSFVFVLLQLWPVLVKASEVNLAYVQFAQFTTTISDQEEKYPVWRPSVEGPNFLFPNRLYESAVESTDSAASNWLAGRIAFARGDSLSASRHLRKALHENPDNPILTLDLLLAGQALSADEGISLQEIDDRMLFQLPIRFFCTEDDANSSVQRYWQGVKQILENRDGQFSVFMLAAQDDSSDLDILYGCWRWSSRYQISPLDDLFSRKLAYFGSDGTYSSYGMSSRAIRVIPKLVDDDLWNEGKAERVASLLVWQQYSSSDVEALLFELAKRNPSDSTWQFLLGELYQRRGDLDRAKVMYEAIYKEVSIHQSAEAASALLQLSMIQQSLYLKTGNEKYLRDAWSRIEEYRKLAADDLLGHKQAVRLATLLHNTDRDALNDEFDSRVSVTRTVSSLLDIPFGQIRLGKNILANGDFEEWTSDGGPIAWRSVDYASGGPFERGFFVNGRDDAIAWSGSSARIHGVWVERDISRQVGLANSGFSPRGIGEKKLPILPSSEEPYVLSFFYRTTTAGLSIWVPGNGSVLWEGNYSLPSTAGDWRLFVLVGWNHTGDDIPIELLFRSFTLGDVWIDNVQLRPVHCLSSTGCRPSEEKSTIR